MSVDSLSTYQKEMTSSYLNYQKQYAQTISERDKVLINMIREVSKEYFLKNKNKDISLLDIGCSTGNLLRHIAYQFPNFSLSGADLYDDIIEYCQNDANLKKIKFFVQDIRRMQTNEKYDVIVANAVLFFMNDTELADALRCIAHSLKPGGFLLGLSWWHSFSQDLYIEEKTAEYPEGLPIYSRSMTTGNRFFYEAGFTETRYFPFEIPIDLPLQQEKDVNTHTVLTAEGTRLQFRGALYQPWCHFAAKKR